MKQMSSPSPISPILAEARREAGRRLSSLTSADRSPIYDGVNSKLPNALFNDIDARPHRMHKKELIPHRLMICLAANGFTHIEIAEKTGYQVSNVSNVLRQPWARARILAMQQDAGMDELQRTLRTACTGAVARVIERAENEVIQLSSPGLAQKVDEYLIDRYLGKPKNQVEHSTKPTEKMTDAEITDILRKFQLEQEGAESVDRVVGEVELTHEGAGAQ